MSTWFRWLSVKANRYASNKAFGTRIDKDVVWRILATHYLITTLIVRTLHLMAIHPQESPAIPSSAVLISTISSGDLIAANYFSCLLPPE